MIKTKTQDELIAALFETVKMTRAGEDIQEMYRDGEYVVIKFEGGLKKAPIGGDSGIAILRDVLKHI